MNYRASKVRDTRVRVTVPFLDFIPNGHRTASASACGIKWLDAQRIASLNVSSAQLLAGIPAWRLLPDAGPLVEHPLLCLVHLVAARRRSCFKGGRLEFHKGHSVAREAELELAVDLGQAVTLQHEVESWQKWKRACKALRGTRSTPYLVPTYFRQRIQQEVQP